MAAAAKLGAKRICKWDRGYGSAMFDWKNSRACTETPRANWKSRGFAPIDEKNGETPTEWKMDGEFHSVTSGLVDLLERSDSHGKKISGHWRCGFEKSLFVREKSAGAGFEKNG